MSGAIALFVKTPGVSPVKTRLAVGIGQRRAEAFHLGSSIAIAQVITDAADDLGATGYFAVAESNALTSPLWNSMPCIYQGEGGLGQRMHCIYTELQRTYGYAILLGADSPQLQTADLLSAGDWLSETDTARFSFGPAGDGGFWLFGGNRPLPESLWNEVAYSRSDTGLEFLIKIRPYGPIQTLRTLNDVDTVDDLAGVRENLSALASPNTAQAELNSLLKTLIPKKA